ncbi:MAG: adenylate cyclase [Parasphingorhabdus sp.]|jgi:adenylate cyclase
MIKESAELKAIARRWAESLCNKDRDVLKNLFCDSECLVYIGTDIDEVWSGKLVREVYPEHAFNYPAFEMQCTEVKAYENGGTGWAIWLGMCKFNQLDFDSGARITFVFVLEQGVWKVAHAHLSFPKPNVEVVGGDLSGFNEIIASIEKEKNNLTMSGTTTVMFTDIVDSTLLASTVGDGPWSETIKWHDDIITGIIKSQGGTLVKSLGDGTMSTFPSVRSALLAANLIRKEFEQSDRLPHLELRMGIHTGDVVATSNDFLGTVVNKTARLASAANASEVVVSDATRAMVSGSTELNFSDPSEVQLKGLEGTHKIFKLL